jgi:hypothetical protein
MPVTTLVPSRCRLYFNGFVVVYVGIVAVMPVMLARRRLVPVVMSDAPGRRRKAEVTP